MVELSSQLFAPFEKCLHPPLETLGVSVPLQIDQILYILSGPDPMRWTLLATGGHDTEPVGPHFDCRSQPLGRGFSSEVRFRSIKAAPRPDGLGWYFSAMEVFFPREETAGNSTIIGTFDPRSGDRIKGRLVALNELPRLLDAEVYMDRLVQPASA